MSVPNGSSQRPAPPPPAPTARKDTRRLLTFAVPGTALLAYLLGFFDAGGAAALGGLPGLCLIGSGTLAGLTLLPGPVRFPAFTIAAPLSVFAALALLQIVMGGGATALVIVITVLAVAQLAGVAGVLLADAGAVKLPGAAPPAAQAPPRPQMPSPMGQPRPGPPGPDGHRPPPPPPWNNPRPAHQPGGAGQPGWGPAADVPHGVPAAPGQQPARPDAARQAHPWQAHSGAQQTGAQKSGAQQSGLQHTGPQQAAETQSSASERDTGTPSAASTAGSERPADETSAGRDDDPWQALVRSDRAQVASWRTTSNPAGSEQSSQAQTPQRESQSPQEPNAQEGSGPQSSTQGPPARLPSAPNTQHTSEGLDQQGSARSGGPGGTRQMPHPGNH
ncbi:hypothetical protein GIY23_19690 [Allosaccharopolyspora coralli]|uniref:Uncharacterized protein n=1 Tax=Allosaccharopolyspora coralli TaxID=2665642 RepID=A0A5Q3QIS9_9PSEU|nr:DUF5336 domain-containing protein [Allosaccharopolyspora coralli]QGK71435.1 hypothetical protein GIY23_19690 [Allosaccharopolyspora coralli]